MKRIWGVFGTLWFIGNVIRNSEGSERFLRKGPSDGRLVGNHSAMTRVVGQRKDNPFPEQPLLAMFPEIGVSFASFSHEGSVPQLPKSEDIWDGSVHSETMHEFAEVYRHWEEDVDHLRKDRKIRTLHLSFSWSRVIDTSTGEPRTAVLEFYKEKVRYAKEQKNMTILATLYHYDFPWEYEQQFGGWADPRMIDRFREYATAVFSSLGMFVDYWITIHNPYQVAMRGYRWGLDPPYQTFSEERVLTVGHHLLLAHAWVVSDFRRLFSQFSHAKISMSVDCTFYVPYDLSDPNDRLAAQRMMRLQTAWFTDPLFFGSYPDDLRWHFPDNLPVFSETEERLLVGSVDFVAVIHSSTYAVQDSGKMPREENNNQSAGKRKKNDTPSAPLWNEMVPVMDHARVIVLPYSVARPTDLPTVWNYPKGIYQVIQWLQARYPALQSGSSSPDAKRASLPIVIVQCGVGTISSSRDQEMDDTARKYFLKNYYTEVAKVPSELSIDVPFFIVWSWMDSFQWEWKRLVRFGVSYIDFDSPEKTRHDKLSLQWMAEVQNALLVSKGGEGNGG